MNLTQKHILLGISGGIAAYKTCELTRRLRDAGADVRVVMTENATRFVTPLTLQALSGNPVRVSLWDEAHEAAMGHIELARWADAILIAPASADLMARLACGMADNLLTTLCLASEAPLLLAPAMNRVMWAHPATLANVQTLIQRGAHILGPASGTQACGESGEGRMLEALALVEQLADVLACRVDNTDTTVVDALRLSTLHGKRVVVTAGATREAIDPVRFLSNRSSGRMGYAMAAAARDAGADVLLISGVTPLPAPQGITRIEVEGALQMREAVHEAMPCDLFIATAAVADYRPAETATQKIKKHVDTLTLELVKNPDILSEVAALAQRPFTVGFAAETEHLLEHARAKLQHKKLDMIAANQVGDGLAFDQPDNALTVLWEGGQVELAQTDKQELARQLIQIIATRMNPHVPA
jgi:phosphopantothenoylcysteine decarboxylase/phosphopantothenate--cysteine ligase